ncbi:hypothetical protein BC826DRAFT_1051504 [Russula brevipes]|nr:hypothetical protein BC826DRAFT_1051504 [Russula brevipes]
MMTMTTWPIQCLAGVATSAVPTPLYCGGFVRAGSLHEGVWRRARTVLGSVVYAMRSKTPAQQPEVGVGSAQVGPPWSPGVKVRGDRRSNNYP